MKIIKRIRMKKIGLYDGIEVYKYTPSLFMPYYNDYPKADHPPYERRFAHKVRMMLEYIRGGFNVYYFKINNTFVGHIVVSCGGRRLTISDKKDIVLGPIFVAPRYRNQGIGTVAIEIVLKRINLNYRFAYEFIVADNEASVKTVKKNGYEFVCHAREKGLLRTLVQSPNGRYVVYRYSNDRR